MKAKLFLLLQSPILLRTSSPNPLLPLTCPRPSNMLHRGTKVEFFPCYDPQYTFAPSQADPRLPLLSPWTTNARMLAVAFHSSPWLLPSNPPTSCFRPACKPSPQACLSFPGLLWGAGEEAYFIFLFYRVGSCRARRGIYSSKYKGEGGGRLPSPFLIYSCGHYV